MKFLAILLFVTVVYEVNGLCNTCSAVTGLACISSTSFKICQDGIINTNSPAVECPPGTYCTANAQVCSSNSSGTHSCEKCGVCEDDSSFACVEYNKFAFCKAVLGGFQPDTVNYTCPGSLICNSGLTPVCTNPNTTGIGATCPLPNVTPTPSITSTANPLTDPNAFCATKRPGKYDISSDLTCQLYIRCVFSCGVASGIIYECPIGRYFNSSTQKCGPYKPQRCT